MTDTNSSIWQCTICGYRHEGSEPPEACPACAAPPSKFNKLAPEETAKEQTGQTKTWVCSVCGYKHQGEEPPDACPVCKASAAMFKLQEPEREKTANEPSSAEQETPDLEDYLSQWARSEFESEENFSVIERLSRTGKSLISPMGTRKPFPGLETILLRGAQFGRFPLNEDDPVSSKTIIGQSAKQPLQLEIPFYVSHMSFGALSREAKIALAQGASDVGTATCSGEGGMLPAERENATRYIYEIGTAPFSRNDDACRKADAVEIKIGQAAKPGMGGHLPAEKVTPEIAQVRGLKPGQSFISPNRQPGIDTAEDLKEMVDHVRQVTEGKPVGVKFTAGRIEEDLQFVLQAAPDFITIDCRGGATGAAPNFVRDHVCLPPIHAIRRARKFLDQANSQVTLCVAGGFRDSTDIAKALALGADAVALATASLISIGCQQYRICNTGKCPVGITTQDPELRARFNIEASRRRMVNFYRATQEEVESLARINGRADVHLLDMSDIFTISTDIAQTTDIAHA